MMRGMPMIRPPVNHPSPGSPRAQHSEQVYLVAQGQAAEPDIDEVSTSWQRSAAQYHVDPDSREAPRILTSPEVNQRREPLDQLVFSAQEELDRLYKVVREAGYTILFCDNAGVAVEHRGDDTDASRFRYWEPGSAACGPRRLKEPTALAPASPKSGLSRFIGASTTERDM